MSIYTPTLRVRLKTIASEEIRKDYYGKGNYNHMIGNTRIHIEQGLIYAEVSWGIDGLDMPVSHEVEEYVDSFEVQGTLSGLVKGIYVLRNGEGKDVLARALVFAYVGDQKAHVSGKKREDVIKLFELLRDGEIRPDVEVQEFEQVEGGLNELRRVKEELASAERHLVARDNLIDVLNDGYRFFIMDLNLLLMLLLLFLVRYMILYVCFMVIVKN